jgi:hypothetical protein
MGLVKNEDFVAVTSRSKDGTLSKIAGIVNTIV